jgi:hypothetical protein
MLGPHAPLTAHEQMSAAFLLNQLHPRFRRHSFYYTTSFPSCDSMYIIWTSMPTNFTECTEAYEITY